MALPNYYTPYPQIYQPQMQPQQIPQQVPQQSNGFVPVPNEDVARNYPVALGASVSFKDENAPYIYTKTMGMSPLAQPIFEKYKLIKEDDVQPVVPKKEEDNKLHEIEEQINALWDEVNSLKAKRTNKKKEGNGDE